MTAHSRYGQIFQFELIDQWRNRSDFVQGLLFFGVILLIFPLAVTSAPDQLRTMAPGMIWIATLFANLLTMSNVFRFDVNSGFIDKCLTVPGTLLSYTYSKVLIHWLLAGLPIVLLTPLLGLLFDLQPHQTILLALSLLVGTPVLSFFGLLGASLILPISQNSLLIPLLVVPMMLPIIIFGVSASDYMMMQQLP